MLRALLEHHDRIAVVCHDAGAANLLLAWIEPEMLPRIVAVAEGPARTLWERRFPSAELSADWTTHSPPCDVLLAGTGWASDLEHRALGQARAMGVRSIAVIDHWVNYRARFVRDGVLELPDEIWVTDEDAVEVARREVPEVPAALMPNLYMDALIRRIRPVEQVRGEKLLYVTEPIRSDWGRQTPGEFAALDFFAEQLPNLDLPRDATVVIRPHPSETHEKYADWIARNGQLRLELDRHQDVADSLSEARWVAGCETSVLVVALKAGRTVFCTLPPEAPPCQLPQAGLIALRDIAPGAGHG